MLENEGGGASTLTQQPTEKAEVTRVQVRGSGGRKGRDDTGALMGRSGMVPHMTRGLGETQR